MPDSLTPPDHIRTSACPARQQSCHGSRRRAMGAVRLLELHQELLEIFCRQRVAPEHLQCGQEWHLHDSGTNEMRSLFQLGRQLQARTPTHPPVDASTSVSDGVAN